MVGEVLQGIKAQEGLVFGMFVVALAGEQRNADRPHQAGVRRPDDLAAGVFFQRAQHGVVFKGAALYDDAVAQRVEVGQPDDLGKDVLDDGAAEPGHDVLGALAVALFGDDAAVHEHRAAAAQHSGLAGSKGRIGDLPGGNAQRSGEVFEKGAAARGTGFIDNDVGDNTVVQPHCLHILAADVKQEGSILDILFGCAGVGHRFDGVILGTVGFGKQHFAVAGRTGCQDVQLGTGCTVAVAQRQQRPLGHIERLAGVGGVEGIQQVFLVIHQHKLGRRAARVDAQKGIDFLAGLGLSGRQGGLLVPLFKGGLLLGRGKERPSGFALDGMRRAVLQPGLQVAGQCGHAVAAEHRFGTDGGAAGHHQLGAVGNKDLVLGQTQALCKHLNQHGIEGQETTFEHDRTGDLQPLGQPADRLFGDGVERR